MLQNILRYLSDPFIFALFSGTIAAAYVTIWVVSLRELLKGRHPVFQAAGDFPGRNSGFGESSGPGKPRQKKSGSVLARAQAVRRNGNNSRNSRQYAGGAYSRY